MITKIVKFFSMIAIFTSACAATGSELTLYKFNACPFCQKVEGILISNDIEYKTVYIDPFNKPEYFLKMNPKGTVPVIGSNTFNSQEVVVGSNQIIHYISQKFNLGYLAKDYEEADRDEALFELKSVVMSCIKEQKSITSLLEEIAPKLEKLESLLASKNHELGSNQSLRKAYRFPFVTKLYFLSQFAPEIGNMVQENCSLYEFIQNNVEKSPLNATISEDYEKEPMEFLQKKNSIVSKYFSEDK